MFLLTASGLHLRLRKSNSYIFEESCTRMFEHITLTKEMLNPLKVVVAMPEILLHVVLYEFIGCLILKLSHDFFIHRAMIENMLD